MITRVGVLSKVFVTEEKQAGSNKVIVVEGNFWSHRFVQDSLDGLEIL